MLDEVASPENLHILGPNRWHVRLHMHANVSFWGLQFVLCSAFPKVEWVDHTSPLFLIFADWNLDFCIHIHILEVVIPNYESQWARLWSCWLDVHTYPFLVVKKLSISRSSRRNDCKSLSETCMNLGMRCKRHGWKTIGGISGIGDNLQSWVWDCCPPLLSTWWPVRMQIQNCLVNDHASHFLKKMEYFLGFLRLVNCYCTF